MLKCRLIRVKMHCRDRESAGTEHQVSDNPCCRIICGRLIRVVLYVFKSKNDLLPTDAIAKYFERPISNHNHNLCRRQLPATPFVLLSSFKQKSLYFRGNDMWNSLPETLKLSDSFNIFKKDLKLFLFQNEAG